MRAPVSDDHGLPYGCLLRRVADAPGPRQFFRSIPRNRSPALTSDESPSDPRRGDPFLEGLAAVLVAIGAFLALRLLASGAGVAGVASAEWLALVILPLAFLAFRRRRIAPALGLAPLPSGSIPAALLLGLGALPMAWFAFWVANVAAPVDPEAARILGRDLVARDGGELLVLLALAALTPAICEEFLFRGLLLRTLLRRHPPALAIGASAATFALLHWTPAGAARMAPTLVLGPLLGWAVWRSGSLWMGMLVHGVYNATLLAGAAWSVGPGPARPGPPPTGVLLVGIGLLFAGTHFLMLRTPTPSRP